MADLVSLLSGRNFETRTNEMAIAEKSFAELREGILDFVDATHFKSLVMTLKSAGFIRPGMINSKYTLNFAYIVYLTLKSRNVPHGLIQKHVRRWLVLSLLTNRYTGGSESTYDQDIRNIDAHDFGELLAEQEAELLSDTFWTVGLVNALETSTASSPYFSVFVAAQVKQGDKGFLSRHVAVEHMLTLQGDVHHIFARDYLRSHGYVDRNQYNQVANYSYLELEVNRSIGNKPPAEYMSEVVQQCSGGELKCGSIDDMETLHHNLKVNCLPEGFETMTAEDYRQFLIERRRLMAAKIRDYYYAL